MLAAGSIIAVSTLAARVIAQMGLVGYGFAGMLALAGFGLTLAAGILKRFELASSWLVQALVWGGLGTVAAAFFAFSALGF